MDRIKAAFFAQNIQLTDSSLCVVFEEANRRNLTAFQAVDFWKNSDLKLFCRNLSHSVLNPLLKPNLSFYTISQGFILQIKCLRDVSRPAYQQLQKILQMYGENTLVNAENDQNYQKETENGHKMLHITFSDGVKEIIGMEYETISSLTVKTPLGTKVYIIPPVICRKGVLVLKANNIRIIGGQVADLEKQFSQKVYLASVIGANLAELEGSYIPCPPADEPAIPHQLPVPNDVAPLQRTKRSQPSIATVTHTFDDDPEIDEWMAAVEDPGWGDIDDSIFDQAEHDLDRTIVLD